MRLKGTLVEWNDDRGFGFVEPADGGSRAFCHISAFEVRVRRPMAGDVLTYELSKGKDGRPVAAKVRPAGLEQAQYQSSVGPKSHRGKSMAEAPRARKAWLSKLVPLAGILGIFLYVYATRPQIPQDSVNASGGGTASVDLRSRQSDDTLRRAFEQRRSNVQVQGSGSVSRILGDDDDGSRHQRFIVRLASGQTLLIAHNIDLAPRVEPLSANDRIEFFGEYEWNDQGGVIHWTHRDPAGRHVGGWIRHKGRTYQ